MAGNRNSGRRPKPTAVLKMQGTYAPGRHEDRPVEAVADGIPVCPTHLTGEARKFWKRTVPKLIKMGVARAADTDTLASMAEWWAAYRTHMDAVVAGDDSKMRGAVKAWDKFLPLADRFGLSPSARIRLTVPKPKETTQDPAAKYFG